MRVPFGFFKTVASAYDTDAAAFFARVVAAGGSLTTTEKNAVNTLVLSLKANSLWSLMQAIYPMVGASAAACAQNLVSSSFTGTFNGGWTYASTGVTGNGTNAYMDTGLNALGFTSLHYSYYSRTNNSVGREVGLDNGAVGYDLILSLSGTLYSRFGTSSITTANSNTTGYYISTEAITLSHKIFKNNAQIGVTAGFGGGYLNQNVYINATNQSGVANSFSSKQCAFASIGNGLTDTQASNFYTAVQAMQTSLSRQV